MKNYLFEEVPSAQISCCYLLIRDGLGSYTLYEEQAEKSLPMIFSMHFIGNSKELPQNSGANISCLSYDLPPSGSLL